MPDQPRPIPATPESLRKTLSRRPVLWVGAGASIAAGHPTTAALVEALIADADDPIDPNLPFEQVADAFVASQGEGALEDLLQRLVGASRPLTDLHRALARQAAGGAFAAIVTTNYDDLLERALAEAERLKEWRALMTQREWDEALPASDALRRGNVRPLVLADHSQSIRLWTEVTPTRNEPQRLALLLEVGASGVSARIEDGGEPWQPENLFADADFITAVDELRELGTRALPTDEHGVLAPAAAGVAVGERLSSSGGHPFKGEWREKVLEPILAQADDRIEADLLLPRVWQALDADAREHLGRCTVLSAPAPLEAIRGVRAATARRLPGSSGCSMRSRRDPGGEWLSSTSCNYSTAITETNLGLLLQKLGRPSPEQPFSPMPMGCF